jgi:ribosomal protein S18 acetylase RimI-like enzyme
VAQDNEGGDVGAVWWRFFDADDAGYGFVAADIPEVTVGVLAAHRGRGAGSRMMRELVDLALTEGLSALSLSVQPDNFAARLYERLGFRRVGTNGGAVTMLLTLSDA